MEQNKHDGIKKLRRDGKFYNFVVNKQIRERMDVLGMKAPSLQQELEKLGCTVTPEAIRQWVSGYSQPRIENLPKIADALSCSVNYLFGGTNICDIQLQKTTLEDLHFTEAAIERLERLSTCQSLVDMGISRGEAQENPIVRENKRFKMLMKLLENDEFYVFLTNAVAYVEYIREDKTEWPKRAQVGIKDIIALDAPTSTIEKLLLSEAIEPVERLLGKIGGVDNAEEI